MVKRLAHLCLVVRDLDKAVSFYRDALGMTEAFPFINAEGKQYGQYFHAGDGTFTTRGTTNSRTGISACRWKTSPPRSIGSARPA